MTNKITVGLAGTAAMAALGGVAIGASGAAAPNSVTVKQSSGLKMKPNRYVQSNMRFNRDTYTVRSGGSVVFLFNKDEEGPHTLSIVKARHLPDNAREMVNCRACEAIAKAHGADPSSDAPPKFAFVENGKGQDTPPNLDRPGDSALTGPKKGSKVKLPVTAAAGKRLAFLCAVHPHMQARLKVVK